MKRRGPTKIVTVIVRREYVVRCRSAERAKQLIRKRLDAQFHQSPPMTKQIESETETIERWEVE